VKRAESSGDIAFSKRLHGGFECWTFLTNNFVEMRSPHSCLLQLLEWPASLNALVLACIANQKHSLLRPKSAEEFSDLVRACQARFVHEVEMPLLRGLTVGPTGQETLQRSRSDAGLGKQRRGARSWRKSFDRVSPIFSGDSDDGEGRLLVNLRIVSAGVGRTTGGMTAARRLPSGR
jgi:hypothetical protein